MNTAENRKYFFKINNEGSWEKSNKENPMKIEGRQ